MASFGEGIAQGLNTGTNMFNGIVGAYQRSQLVQLEQQKQNLEGYKTFSNMLQTWDPDTAKAAWPSVAKSLFNVDPSDVATKNFYMQAFDKQSQIGGAVRDAFQSINGNDPNDPIAKVMKNTPITTFALMAKDPAKLTSFLSGVNTLRLQKQAQGLIDNATSAINGQPASATSTPAPSQPAAPDTLATNSNAAAPAAPPAASMATSPVPAGPDASPTLADNSAAATLVPADATPAAAPAPTLAAAQAPAPAPPAPVAAPVAAAAPPPASAPAVATVPTPGAPPASGAPTVVSGPLGARIAALRTAGARLSANPYTAKMGENLSTQANQLETNALAAQRNQSEAAIAGADVANSKTNAARLKLDKLTKTGYTEMTPAQLNQHGYAPEQHVLLNANTGDVKVIDPATESIKQNYLDPASTILTAAANSRQQLPALNTLDALLRDTNNPTTAGPFATSRLFFANLASSLGHTGLGKKLLGTAPNTQVEEAAIAQITSQVSSELRKGFGGGAAQIENVADNLPELADSRQGQEAIVTSLIAARNRGVQAGQIIQDHLKNVGPLWERDINGQNAIDKANSFLNSSSGVPQSLLQALDTGGPTKTIVAPPGSNATAAAIAGTYSNPIIPKSQADIDNAKSGTYFQTPKGLMRK